MYEFFYHVRFNVENEKLNIRIFLSLEDFFTSVYIRTFEALVLQQEASFLSIYHEIEEYFVNKNIVINEEDLNLFYETLNRLNITLPQITSVALNLYDDDLDQYNPILTPKDIIFLKYLDGKAIDDKRFASWEKDNNLNTTILREELLKNKLVTTSNYEYNLTKAKREDLLDVVKLYELDVHGDNKDLVEMIKNKLSDEDVKKHFSGSHYTLTDKGKRIIEKSKKIIDFDHSFFRYVHKLSIEEFHLLSIKKSDYDFNGIGRLLMVNSNSNQLKHFDWDSLKKDEIKNDVEVIEVDEKTDDEFFDYINNISETNKMSETNNISEFNKMSETNNISETYNKDDKDKTDEVEVEHLIEKETDYSNEEKVIEEESPIIYDDTTEVDIDEIYFEEDPRNLEKLEAYRKKREIYEKSKSGKYKKHLNKRSNNRRKKHLIFKWLLYIILFIILLVGILYLIEKFEIINLPFSVEDIFQSLKNTFNEYKNEVIDFIEYIKDYKSE